MRSLCFRRRARLRPPNIISHCIAITIETCGFVTANTAITLGIIRHGR